MYIAIVHYINNQQIMQLFNETCKKMKDVPLNFIEPTGSLWQPGELRWSLKSFCPFLIVSTKFSSNFTSYSLLQEIEVLTLSSTSSLAACVQDGNINSFAVDS